MNNIRVARVIGRMNVGGPARQVVVLERELPARGYQSKLLVGEVQAGELDHLELYAHEVPVSRIRGLGRALRPTDDLRAYRALVRAFTEFKPHIVHTHTAKAGLLGRLAAWRSGVPITVHTFHGHLLHGYFPRSLTSAVIILERALAKRTTTLVSVGERVRDDLLSAGVGRPGQYEVVPPGIDFPRSAGATSARLMLGITADARVVAFSGRLSAIKRPERLLDVARMVRRVVPNVLFIVAGGGDLLEQLRRQAEDLNGCVRFLGWRRDIGDIYAASDVVLLTSDNEGMPVSLIEASAAGRPCVTPAVGSAPEVVLHGETGFVTGRQPQALASAVIALLTDDELRARMGRAAQRHAEARFSSRRLVTDTDAIYRDALRRAELSASQ